MNLRPATVADLAAIVRLEAEVFPPPHYPYFFFRQALDLWPTRIVVAEQEELLGYAIAARGDEAVTILSVAVTELARGQGVGRALIQALLEADPDATHQLTVHPDSPAVRLYLSMGFQVAGRDETYFGEREPRLVLRR